MIRFPTAILLIGRCIIDIIGLEYVGLAYYTSTDTEVYILMHRSKAYDMGYVDVSSCIPTNSAVCDATTTKLKAKNSL